ncbi:hypothetical protein [Bradyrhizobium neotropicale]|uniref:hypothetical protein n=1 Tax=Bradyrhizobium neotropicale TaxID=1497615 RepID=UPI001AD72C28|nr:hypothetical protein [Bradyrhizobium neotropicale]MBO4226817.1 hypothetical protein [Bradyrhizobium neotropicale]
MLKKAKYRSNGKIDALIRYDMPLWQFLSQDGCDMCRDDCNQTARSLIDFVIVQKQRRAQHMSAPGMVLGEIAENHQKRLVERQALVGLETQAFMDLGDLLVPERLVQSDKNASLVLESRIDRGRNAPLCVPKTLSELMM